MELQFHGTSKDGVIIKAENFNIVSTLKKKFGYDKIYIKNDAKCGGLCEKKYGTLREYENCIFICLGTGIGGAVFYDNKLLKGKEYAGFEIRTYRN